MINNETNGITRCEFGVPEDMLSAVDPLVRRIGATSQGADMIFALLQNGIFALENEHEEFETAEMQLVQRLQSLASSQEFASDAFVQQWYAQICDSLHLMRTSKSAPSSASAIDEWCSIALERKAKKTALVRDTDPEMAFALDADALDEVLLFNTTAVPPDVPLVSSNTEAVVETIEDSDIEMTQSDDVVKETAHIKETQFPKVPETAPTAQLSHTNSNINRHHQQQQQIRRYITRDDAKQHNNVNKRPPQREEEVASAATAAVAALPPAAPNAFMSAKEQYIVQHAKQHGRLPPAMQSLQPQNANANATDQTQNGGPLIPVNQKKKTLGGKRRFNVPFANINGENGANNNKRVMADDGSTNGEDESGGSDKAAVPQDERLKHLDPKLIALIESEIMSRAEDYSWDDIAGLEHAKKSIYEIIVLPMLRPDLFTGLRSAPRGLLLFGPPGTGKTLIGKCIASNSNSTFFAISASSLTSKWVGEAEKLVRTLFTLARVHAPSVVFIDEIDSLLSARSDNEQESSRRMKTEFLVQLDGATTSRSGDGNGNDQRVLLIGATNRPHEIDEAARRRLVKRLYIPLPDANGRHQLLSRLLQKSEETDISEADLSEIVNHTEGYSGSDIHALCQEAAMGPIREIPASAITGISQSGVRKLRMSDFTYAMTQVRASVSQTELGDYVKWNSEYGSMG